MGNDDSVARAAWVSRGDDTRHHHQDEVERVIRYMMRHRHTSPFEHVSFTFRITCDLATRTQWQRHRTWSYNEISRRYTEENVEVMPPPVWRGQAATNKQASAGRMTETDQHRAHVNYGAAMSACMSAYRNLIALGVAREQARMVLPMATMTAFYGTVNLHNLLHFCGLRCAPDAQQEIRVLADECLRIAETVAPISVRTWREVRGV
jgi:thymidylate synthase (FAD)